MNIEYLKLHDLKNGYATIDNVIDCFVGEQVTLVGKYDRLQAEVISYDSGRAVIKILDETKGLSLSNYNTVFGGNRFSLKLSQDMLGRSFDFAGRATDGFAEILPKKTADIHSGVINPAMREYSSERLCSIELEGECLDVVKGQSSVLVSDFSAEFFSSISKMLAEFANCSDNVIVLCRCSLDREVSLRIDGLLKDCGMIDRTVKFDGSSKHLGHALACAVTASEYLAFDNGKQVLVLCADVLESTVSSDEIAHSLCRVGAIEGICGSVSLVAFSHGNSDSEILRLFDRKLIIK